MAARKKSAKTTGKAKAKRDVGGRPTKYLASYNEQARKLALLGMTDKKMAEFFNIGEATLNRWKIAHPTFRESTLAGKEQADANVAASLYQLAVGGGTVTEIREEPDSEGNIVRKKVIRELPPDSRSIRYFLGNRQPKLWRDRVIVEDATPPEKLAETAMRFEEVMVAARERQRQVLVERGLLAPDDA